MARRRNDPLWRRHTAELVVAAIGLVLVTGLWLANRGGDGDGATAPATSTTTVDPGADPATTPDDAEGASGDEDADASADDADDSSSLRDAVLRRSDLPAGWTAAGVSGSAAALCAGQDPLAASRPVDTARAVFTSGSGSKVVGGTVAGFSASSRAVALLRAVRDATAACERGPGSYELVHPPRIGEEVVGVSFEVPAGATTTRGVLYVSRVGARVAIVSATTTGGAVDRELALQALRAEVGRL